MKSEIFMGTKTEVWAKYNRFIIENGIEVVCASLCQDFSEYGNTKQFVLLVTYKNKA